MHVLVDKKDRQTAQSRNTTIENLSLQLWSGMFVSLINGFFCKRKGSQLRNDNLLQQLTQRAHNLCGARSEQIPYPPEL